MQRLALLALLSAVAPAAASVQQQVQEANANPIRKVVNLLTAMQKKVTAEGQKEEELYDKFMCYCKGSGGDLSGTISALETKVPQLGSSIEEGESKLVQLKEDLKQAQVDRSAAKGAMAEATALREKDHAAYAAEKADYDTNIDAMTKAVGALEKGMGGAFLQTSAAQILRKLAMSKAEMLDVDRQELVSFLSAGSDYAPASGEITGILKNLLDSMKKAEADLTSEEEGSAKSYEELMSAKTKEVEALSAAIEAKTTRIGELGVEIVQMKEDLSDSEAQLIKDKEFMANLSKSCETKTAEWEERQKTRGEELVALSETIKILNDDDALDLFKKTLPGASSASFVQMKHSAVNVRTHALAEIQKALASGVKRDKTGLEMLVLALSGKRALSKGGFEKVIKMIDDLVVLLKQEQMDDEHKKEYCQQQLDHSDDSKKELEKGIADATASIETAQESIATLTEEIASLEKSIKAMDKDVAEQTEQRKEENAEYQELMSSNAAAKQLLEYAKNRLNKFYNPKLYAPPPVPEEDAALVQISEHRSLSATKDEPAPPPGTWTGGLKKKSEESSGVIGMIDLLIKDLDKEMTEAEVEEKDAQSEYEKFMGDSASKRAEDSGALADKGKAKAEIESDLENHKEDKSSTTKELMATLKYIQSLHGECDWLLQHFDIRKEARAGEVESLKNAKAALSGADY
jgi:chromosome segregation ATPase